MSTRQVKWAWATMWALALATLLGCSKDHSPVAYQNPLDNGQVSIPPVPINLVTQVADQSISLTWEVSDTTDVRWYRVARQDSLKGPVVAIDSVAQRRYTDRALKNGHIYRYCVCVVTRDGFVGSYSHQMTGVPSGFGLTIDGGNKYTNTFVVTLTISAPRGASLMMVANDSLFSEASWEDFVSQKSWHLPSPDGRKEVFLKLRDLDDNQSSGIYHDDIILDTRASISHLTFSPQDSVLAPGDQVHFTMETGEPGGLARIDIGAVAMDKWLSDDGTHGDEVADDGIYELNFIIPGGLEAIEAVIRGRFTDEAGNDAEEVAAVKTLSIQKAPTAVMLFTPIPLEGDETALHLTWSQNQDADFIAYHLYRSEVSGVGSAPDRTLVAAITSQLTTFYDDSELEENTTYYYQLSVYDQYGLCSHSNEVSATTGANQAPEPVVLLITSVGLMPSDSTAAQIELKWTRSPEVDFDHYIIYRDRQSPVDTSSTPVDLINDRQVTAKTDTQLELSSQYFYRVYVCDESGLCTGSNEVNAITPSGQ